MASGGIPDDGKLKYAVFAALYLESGTSTGLEAYEYNFAGIDLSNFWGEGSSSQFNSNKQFFCLKSETTMLPYAVFDDLANTIKLLLERWNNRMFNVASSSEKDIAKFWILNMGANILPDNVYTGMGSTQLTSIEDKVKKSIDIWNAVPTTTTTTTTTTP